MLKAALLASALCAVGCSWSIDQSRVRKVNHVAMGVMIASLECDYWSTVVVARDDWRAGPERGVPTKMLIGEHPSVAALTAYHAGALAVIVAGSYLLPEKYRWILYGAVTSVEGAVIEGNMIQSGRGMCGL